eukprot:Selendium_serpulae@DN5830_c1_g1_i3.p1
MRLTVVLTLLGLLGLVGAKRTPSLKAKTPKRVVAVRQQAVDDLQNSTHAPQETPPVKEVNQVTSEERWKFKAQKQLLNVDLNYGFYFEAEGPLKAEHFAKTATSFRTLTDFDRYTAKFYKDTSNYLLEFRDLSTKGYHFIRVADEPYITEEGNVRYDIERTDDITQATVLDVYDVLDNDGEDYIDDSGGSPFCIVAYHHITHQTLLLFFERDGRACFKQYFDKDRINVNFFFYLAENIDQSNSDAWASFSPNDTYFMYNQHYKKVATPFAKDDRVDITDWWGPTCRLGCIARGSPHVKLQSTSSYTMAELAARGLTSTEVKATDGRYKVTRSQCRLVSTAHPVGQ